VGRERCAHFANVLRAAAGDTSKSPTSDINGRMAKCRLSDLPDQAANQSSADRSRFRTASERRDKFSGVAAHTQNVNPGALRGWLRNCRAQGHSDVPLTGWNSMLRKGKLAQRLREETAHQI